MSWRTGFLQVRVKCRTRSGDETASIDSWIHSESIKFKCFFFSFVHTWLCIQYSCVFVHRRLLVHQGVQVMWIEIHQNQQSVVMKVLWGKFSHDYSQAPASCSFSVAFLMKILPSYIGPQYSFNLCCFYYPLNWLVPSTGRAVWIKIIQELFSALRVWPRVYLSPESLETDSPY